MTETRYLVPGGAQWAVWDDANGVLSFMTDEDVVENARENQRERGTSSATRAGSRPTRCRRRRGSSSRCCGGRPGWPRLAGPNPAWRHVGHPRLLKQLAGYTSRVTRLTLAREVAIFSGHAR